MSLIINYDLPNNRELYIHRWAGLPTGRWGWGQSSHSSSIPSSLVPPQNRPLGQVWPEGRRHQLCEERRHPHPAGHRAVLLHPDRRDAHERCVLPDPPSGKSLGAAVPCCPAGLWLSTHSVLFILAFSLVSVADLI